MCGIIGYIGQDNCVSLLVDGLKRLEYRGYDSAGVAVLVNGTIEVRRCQGKLKQLESLLIEKPVEGTIGIGHTRWATHGEPNDINAHPHYSQEGDLAIIHNGIIENYDPIKKDLISKGYVFQSETDTEVLC